MTREEQRQLLVGLVNRLARDRYWQKDSDGIPRPHAAPYKAAHLDAHLDGSIITGLCPIKRGESTCKVAVLDFDSHKGETPWEEMLNVVFNINQQLALLGIITKGFRSSGGKGVHLIATWDEPQDAFSARKTISQALSACEYTSGTAGVSNRQVEIFPKQNEVGESDWGSMFVLPFAGASEIIPQFAGAESWVPSLNVKTFARPTTTKSESFTRDSREINPALTALEAQLSHIPNKDASYDEWFRLAAAVHATTDGSPEGLELFRTWSRQSNKHVDEFLDTRVWPYLRSERDGGTVGPGHIARLARASGWADPSIEEGFPVSDPPDPSKLRFQGIDFQDFFGGPRPGWTVYNFLPKHGVGTLFGPSGSGKSFFVLDLACSVAFDQPFWDLAVKPGNVFYVAAEGGMGMKKRAEAYGKTHNVPDRDRFTFLPANPNLMKAEEVTELIKSIKSKGDVRLVIIDTFAQVTPGANENSAEDVGFALGQCGRIKDETGSFVLLVHHTGKDILKGARGWSGIKAAMDMEAEVAFPDGGHTRTVTVTKQKDGESGQVFNFQLKEVDLGVDEDGRPVKSCVVQSTGVQAPKIKTKAPKHRQPQGAVCRKVMAAFADLSIMGDEVGFEELVQTTILKLSPPLDGKDRRREEAVRAIKTCINGDYLMPKSPGNVSTLQLPDCD